MSKGKRFKYYREVFGLSQSELAKKINVEVTLIQRIEQDRKDVLDLSVRDFRKIQLLYYDIAWNNDVLFKELMNFRHEF